METLLTLYGDEQMADTYRRWALVKMDEVRQRMGLNSLAQDRQRWELPDGTVVVIRCTFTFNHVEIYHPPKAIEPEVEIVEEEKLYGDYLVVKMSISSTVKVIIWDMVAKELAQGFEDDNGNPVVYDAYPVDWDDLDNWKADHDQITDDTLLDFDEQWEYATKSPYYWYPSLNFCDSWTWDNNDAYYDPTWCSPLEGRNQPENIRRCNGNVDYAITYCEFYNHPWVNPATYGISGSSSYRKWRRAFWYAPKSYNITAQNTAADTHSCLTRYISNSNYVVTSWNCGFPPPDDSVIGVMVDESSSWSMAYLTHWNEAAAVVDSPLFNCAYAGTAYDYNNCTLPTTYSSGATQTWCSDIQFVVNSKYSSIAAPPTFNYQCIIYATMLNNCKVKAGPTSGNNSCTGQSSPNGCTFLTLSSGLQYNVIGGSGLSYPSYTEDTLEIGVHAMAEPILEDPDEFNPFEAPRDFALEIAIKDNLMQPMYDEWCDDEYSPGDAYAANSVPNFGIGSEFRYRTNPA